jgi:hypothetical protein
MKFKLMDAQYTITKKGYTGVIPAAIVAATEGMMKDPYFAVNRNRHLDQFICDENGGPRKFMYPADEHGKPLEGNDPLFFFIIRLDALSGDGKALRKECGLSGGSAKHNRSCIYCDAEYGMYNLLSL